MKINEYFYHLRGRDSFVNKKHLHNEIELIEVKNADGVILKNDVLYPLKSGYLYFIDARHPHIVKPCDCDSYVRNKIVIDADSFFGFCEELGLTECADRLFNGAGVLADKEIDLLYREAVLLCMSENAEQIGFAHAYILQIIKLAYESIDASPKSAYNDIIQRIFDAVSKQDGVINLDELSSKLNYSKFYLCHVFKEKMGITVSEYIEDKLYEKSIQLLYDENNSICQISSRCGFANSSSFTRFFKRKSGISPSEFRKKIRKGN